jgi:type IV secretion system protein TrbJ
MLTKPILVFILGLLFSLNIYAYDTVYDPTACADLVTQISNMEEQLQVLKTQIETLKDGDYEWSNAQSLINDLGNTVSQIGGLSYTAKDINTQFQKLYPGYQAPQDYNTQYQQITDNTQNTLNGVLQSVGMSADDFETESSRLAFLQNQVQSAQGQTAAIQAASQIASEAVTQTQLLRQTVVAQTNAQTVYYAQQVQKEADARAVADQVIMNGNTQAVPLDSYPLNDPVFN